MIITFQSDMITILQYCGYWSWNWLYHLLTYEKWYTPCMKEVQIKERKFGRSNEKCLRVWMLIVFPRDWCPLNLLIAYKKSFYDLSSQHIECIFDYSPKSWFPNTAQCTPNLFRTGIICSPFVNVLTRK